MCEDDLGQWVLTCCAGVLNCVVSGHARHPSQHGVHSGDVRSAMDSACMLKTTAPLLFACHMCPRVSTGCAARPDRLCTGERACEVHGAGRPPGHPVPVQAGGLPTRCKLLVKETRHILCIARHLICSRPPIKLQPCSNVLACSSSSTHRTIPMISHDAR